VVLQGREVERARLAALADQARSGQAAVLAVLGEPGVGKSALLQDLVSSQQAAADVTGVRVLRTHGVESESPLPFAALHRLLRPVLRLERLPVPQARALRVAFGQEEGSSVEPFLVGVATLSALTEAAEDEPVLCVVDDAQWLDTASAGALLFAARQLQADPVAIVFAARDTQTSRGNGTGTGSFNPDGLPVMRLGGLDDDAARQLLFERAGEELPDEVSDRLIRESGGNPLALLELPTGLTTGQLQGTAPLPSQLPLTAGVERAFLDQCRRLPEQVQTLLLVTAADDTGRVATLRQAAGHRGVQARAWVEAEQSSLLSVEGDVVAVKHPLVRSAVYQAATSSERRQAHRALADALGDDPDRATWHRAAAADGPDEGLAEALGLAGARAEQRGGYERAAELTIDEAARAARLFAAARNAWASGQAIRARALAMLARELADDALLRADIERLRGRIEVNVGSATDAHRIFMQAARAVVDQDPVRALEMAVAATLMRSYGADSGTPLHADTLTVAVEAGDTTRTRCLKHLLAAMTLAGNGAWGDAVAALRPALAIGHEVEDLDLLGNLGNAALNLGDDEASLRFYTQMLTNARVRGAGMSAVYALQRLAFPQLLVGQWRALRSSADEALTLARGVGQQALTVAPLAWLTLLAALQGTTDYENLLAELEEAVATHRLGILTDPVHDLTRWAKAACATHHGDTSAALHHLSQMRLPVLTRMAAPDRIDAAVRAGAVGQAAAWTAELAPFAEATQWPWALASVTYGRAMTADPADAADLFETALARYRSANRPYDQARTQLAYGEFLRRTHRRVDARTHLRAALETFTDLNAGPLIARTTQELRASGETARKRDPSTLLQLTPMELKVAQLVSTGLSNKDIAAQCWVSPRTVAFHLRNVFAKAGVSSRGELAQLDLG
jgi:DNA-binding CsgD family transcriptional regulator